MKNISQNPEVFQHAEDIVAIDGSFIEELKKRALKNPRRRIRLNLHRNVENTLHEMIIVHTNETYVPPHRHQQKTESFHVIEGEFDVVIFGEDGEINKVVPMGPIGTGRNFCYRVVENFYHSLVIHSEIVVFHEVTNGPFIQGQTEFPNWAPKDGSGEEQLFLQNLRKRVADFR